LLRPRHNRFPGRARFVKIGGMRRPIAAVVLFAAVTGVAAQLPGPDVTVKAPASMAYGAPEMLEATASFPWMQCYSIYPGVFDAPFTYSANGIDLGPIETGPSSIASCVSTPGYVVRGSARLGELGLGDHLIDVQYSGSAYAAVARSHPVKVSVAPHFEGPLPDGGVLKLAVTDPLYPYAKGSCALLARAGAFGAAGWPSTPPPNAESVTALFSVESGNCDWHTYFPGGFLGQGPPPLPALARRVIAQRDIDFPAGTVAWAYGPTAEDPSSHWHELRTASEAKNTYFEIVDGGHGDESLSPDSRIRAIIALAVPKHAAVAGRFQDLWWSGPQENGWGLSITQHRDVLFGELFIYDDQGRGNARWLAMPSGQWNASKTAYTANVYRPRGTPYNLTYDPTQFSIGASVGTVTLTPSSQDAMRLDYVIDGIRGTKQLSRIPFGRQSASPLARFDDLWWAGPAQNGWGLVVAQQYRTIFALWYTYDEQGDATWFVAPALFEAGRGLYGGDLYRPSGGPWLGATYDPNRHSLAKVGTFGLELAQGWESGLMRVSFGTKDLAVPISRLPF
jgi:hypothetical protein